MLGSSQAPILVGVDGSEFSDNAIRWAAREAVLRDRPLRVVHAFVWPMLNVPLGPPPGAPTGAGLRATADRLVTEAAALAREEAPSIQVETDVVSGAAAAVLIGAAQDAVLLVVGCRGMGGLSGLLVGSVGVQTATYAPCPVAVVRGPRPSSTRPRPVVVGVDGSPASTAAVGVAFEEADLRHRDLAVLHAWTNPIPAEPGDMLPPVYDVDSVAAEEGVVLAESIAGWRDKFPDVRVDERVVHQRPRHALVAASNEAELLIVGARGRGGFRGLLLGSVSQHVMHHAECPVMIARHAAAIGHAA
ncbi:MAG: universal stress protein [Actinocatenispora sp.]